jgi:hypothetical protein
MSSAAEAKLDALYINAREAIPMQHLLKEMGHKQPPTPIQTNNSTAHGVITNNIQPCRAKVIAAMIPKANFDTTGAQDPTTEPTTGPNITAPLITSRNAPQY